MTVCTEEPEKVAILIIDELLDVIGQACVPLAAVAESFAATSIFILQLILTKLTL